ncbi:unnamed protein product [Rhizophagus irregularis]|nr:unnamed protein product [Rhizophagus irregularis]
MFIRHSNITSEYEEYEKYIKYNIYEGKYYISSNYYIFDNMIDYYEIDEDIINDLKHKYSYELNYYDQNLKIIEKYEKLALKPRSSVKRSDAISDDIGTFANNFLFFIKSNAGFDYESLTFTYEIVPKYQLKSKYDFGSEGFGIFGCGILDIDFGWDTGYDQFLNASQSSIDVSIEILVLNDTFINYRYH